MGTKARMNRAGFAGGSDIWESEAIISKAKRIFTRSPQPHHPRRSGHEAEHPSR